MKMNKKGQALFEIIPSFIIFAMIVSAGLSYFRIMRFVTIRQEVARNLAFGKIDNSGSLTTQPFGRNEVGARKQPFLGVNNPNVEGGGVVAPGVDSDDAITRKANCYMVIPQAVKPTFLFFGNIRFLKNQLGPIEKTINTYAVVYRQPGGSCGN